MKKALTKTISHSELQSRAAVWLKAQGYCIVVQEARALASAEAPDAFGVDYKGRCAVVEAKTNRKDFSAEKRKPFRLASELGIGDRRYYAAPKGMLRPEELPAGWGLLEPHGRGLKLVKSSEGFPKSNKMAAMALLVSICRFRSEEAIGEHGRELGRRRKGTVSKRTRASL